MTGPAAPGPPRALFRRWVHVREEDRPGVRVYRPAEAPLPPARGRDGIEFRPDGTVVRFTPGPVDAPVGTAGRWTADGPHRLTVSAGGLAAAPVTYAILTVDDEVLRLRAAD